MSKEYVLFEDTSLPLTTRYAGGLPGKLEPINVTLSKTGLKMLIDKGEIVHVLRFDEAGRLVDEAHNLPEQKEGDPE